MSVKILDSTTGLTENGAAGSVFTYEVNGTAGDTVVFQGTNMASWPTNPVNIVSFTITTTDRAESAVLTHSWNKIRAVVSVGTPSYAVYGDKEV